MQQHVEFIQEQDKPGILAGVYRLRNKRFAEKPALRIETVALRERAVRQVRDRLCHLVQHVRQRQSGFILQVEIDGRKFAFGRKFLV